MTVPPKIPVPPQSITTTTTTTTASVPTVVVVDAAIQTMIRVLTLKFYQKQAAAVCMQTRNARKGCQWLSRMSRKPVSW